MPTVTKPTATQTRLMAAVQLGFLTYAEAAAYLGVDYDLDAGTNDAFPILDAAHADLHEWSQAVRENSRVKAAG